jgi:hypothetical protein
MGLESNGRLLPRIVVVLTCSSGSTVAFIHRAARVASNTVGRRYAAEAP